MSRSGYPDSRTGGESDSILAEIQKASEILAQRKATTGLGSISGSFDLSNGAVVHIQDMEYRHNIDVVVPEYGEGAEEGVKKESATFTHLGFVVDDDLNAVTSSLDQKAVIAPAESENPNGPEVNTVHYGSNPPNGTFPTAWTLTDLYPNGIESGNIDWRNFSDPLSPVIVSWHGERRYADRHGKYDSESLGSTLDVKVYVNGVAAPDTPYQVVGAGLNLETNVLYAMVVGTGGDAHDEVTLYTIACDSTVDPPTFGEAWTKQYDLPLETIRNTTHSGYDTVYDLYHHWIFSPDCTSAVNVHVLEPQKSYLSYDNGAYYYNLDITLSNLTYSFTQLSEIDNENFVGTHSMTPDESKLTDTDGTLTKTITSSGIIGVDFLEDGTLVVLKSRRHIQIKDILYITYTEVEGDFFLDTFNQTNISTVEEKLTCVRIADDVELWDFLITDLNATTVMTRNATVSCTGPETDYVGKLIDVDMRLGMVAAFRDPINYGDEDTFITSFANNTYNDGEYLIGYGTAYQPRGIYIQDINYDPMATGGDPIITGTFTPMAELDNEVDRQIGYGSFVIETWINNWDRPHAATSYTTHYYYSQWTDNIYSQSQAATFRCGNRNTYIFDNNVAYYRGLNNYVYWEQMQVAKSRYAIYVAIRKRTGNPPAGFVDCNQIISDGVAYDDLGGIVGSGDTDYNLMLKGVGIAGLEVEE